MSDTRRKAAWYTEGWYKAGDEIVVHLTDNKPPVEKWRKQPIQILDGEGVRWWMICPRPSESCVVCDHGDMLREIEMAATTCACFTTCGEVCDECADLTKHLEETK